MPQKIRIAISGGGVAGASLLHALLQYSHLDVHIFESAPEFREAGIAFGLARNATAALDLLGSSMTQCLERAGGVPMKGVRILVGQGKDAGAMVYEADNEQQGKQTTTIVQRANFLRELLAKIPAERMHASKKLTQIERRADGSVSLRFSDTTTHECDILIGADGIHSTVRRTILGEDNPAAVPINTGSWAIMTLQPFEKAQASIGSAPVDVESAREYGWIGDGMLMMHNVLSDGRLVQFTICGTDEYAKDSDQWQKELSASEIRELVTRQSWPEHLRRAVIDLLCIEPAQRAIYLWEHPHAHTYVDGPLCVMGDAAHATTPWQGSGGGMCIEDTLILATLLGRAESPRSALTALKVYNQLRLPRTQRIVQSSHDTGTMLTGKGKDTRLDKDRLSSKLRPRWDFIVDFDNAEHCDEAIRLMDAELQNPDGGA